MSDIKTRDIVKGTIKAIDKAAIAGERVKAAYVRARDKAPMARIPQRIPRMNTRTTVFQAAWKPLLTRPSGNVTGRGARL